MREEGREARLFCAWLWRQTRDSAQYTVHSAQGGVRGCFVRRDEDVRHQTIRRQSVMKFCDRREIAFSREEKTVSQKEPGAMSFELGAKSGVACGDFYKNPREART